MLIEKKVIILIKEAYINYVLTSFLTPTFIWIILFNVLIVSPYNAPVITQRQICC